MTGGGEEGCQQEGDDERKVEKNWCSGRGSEALQRVKDAAVERHQRDQQQIRKSDAGEFDRQCKALRIAREARREHTDHGGREYQRNCKQHDLAGKEQSEDAICKLPGANGAPLLANARIGGNKGCVESPFCKDGTEVIGQTKGDKEGIGDRTRAEHRSQDDVTDKPADTRQQRETADRQNALNHRKYPCSLAESTVDKQT